MTLLGDGWAESLLVRALVYTIFYAALVYLPLRAAVAAACHFQLRAARRKAERARKATRPRTA